ncbi:SPOR domain-containing protein [Lacinutrix jangbogonensis]|uniref:SPOR domain-containing protein n=1 Tax=Lacinutrix jangbogonensis TaxID=1469557 RepID=UPI00068BA578|nr:SPOR domain-containing protein [Lacinutrix jangbogonensis]
MPHVEEQDYKNLLAFQDSNEALTKEVNHTKEQKRKVTILSIILACLFFLTLATFIFYVFSYSKDYVKVQEYQQIIETDSLEAYKQKIINLEQKSTSLEQMIANVEVQESIKDQIIYAVQIGAFKERDLSLFSSNLVNFTEISESGYNKYALGNFSTLQEAQDFRGELVKLGFKDAFIASFKNDKRLKIEEAN